jgi:hypothetical protein
MVNSRGSGPDFLCIGMQKAGTAWLFDQLDAHPDFWMPPLKELHFFDSRLEVKRLDSLLRRMQTDAQRLLAAKRREGRRAFSERDLDFLARAGAIKGTPQDLDKYAELFAPKGELISGDITPGYSRLPENTIRDIAEHFPALKIVLLLRDPIDRIWSQLNMQIRKGKFSGPDLDDWNKVREVLRDRAVAAGSNPTAIWTRWNQFIPASRIARFFFDDLVHRPNQFRESILAFLGGDPNKESGPLQPDFNRKASHPKIAMSPGMREHMIDFFREELLACARIFGGPANDWLMRYGVTAD